MPRWIINLIIIVASVTFLPLMAVYVTRAQRNPDTRMSIIPDMDDQQKFKAQEANWMFADGRAMRPAVEGTVARGGLDADDHFYRGIVDGQWATEFPAENPTTGAPIVIDEAFIMRGQERFNIYCSVCHGYTGDGGGMVAQRVEELALNGDGVHTWTPPLSYYTAQVRNRPNGHIFNTITNGIRNMPPYGPQVPPEDRWAIVAYVRALQNTQPSGAAEVPEAEPGQVEAQAAAPPGAAAADTEAAGAAPAGDE